MQNNKTFFIATFGCKVNQYESQLIEEHYAAQGMKRVNTAKEAAFILINSCTVTAEADRQCRQLIRKLRKENPETPITVTGCYAARSPKEIIDGCGAVVSERISPYGSISSFSGHSRAFMKVQDGCDARCTYCIVPSVRPELWSKPYGQIEKEIRSLVAAGYPEIVLTGIHLGRYEGGIAALLRRLLEIEGEFRFRLSSLEMHEVADELIGIMRDNPVRVCPHLHIPLQSGSDQVLSRMGRTYDRGRFFGRLAKIRTILPDAAITTDIITGFPGETEQHAEETLDFVRKAAFSRLHVFPFSARSGTPAAGMPAQVPGSEIKKRARALIELGQALRSAYESRFIDSVREAVVEKEGGTVSYLTDNYLSLDGTDAVVPPSGLVKVRMKSKKGGGRTENGRAFYGEIIESH